MRKVGSGWIATGGCVMELTESGEKAEEPIAAKPKVSMKDWIRRAYVENLITVLINTVIMGGIYFYVIGYQFLSKVQVYPKVNSRASIKRIFFLVFVPYITMMVPVTIIRSARGSYFRGKWEVRKAIRWTRPVS
jgi:hypothetical protein